LIPIIEKQKDKIIIALIERYCKKNLVFARPLLPFGIDREANAHCTHLQIAQADPQTEICKRVQFLPMRNTEIDYFCCTSIKYNEQTDRKYY